MQVAIIRSMAQNNQADFAWKFPYEKLSELSDKIGLNQSTIIKNEFVEGIWMQNTPYQRQVFLLILVFTMKGMSRFAMFVNERHGIAENVSSQPLIKGQGQDGMRGDLVAAITAAINSYRATHR